MEILQQLVNGLTIGSIYALVAIGFSVVYGVLGLVNFGHGSVLMAGTFMAYWLSGLGVPIWVACIAGIALGAALNGLVEVVSVRPVLHANLLIPMMTTFGMALIIRNLAELKFGSSTLPFRPSPARGSSRSQGWASRGARSSPWQWPWRRSCSSHSSCGTPGSASRSAPWRRTGRRHVSWGCA